METHPCARFRLGNLWICLFVCVCVTFLFAGRVWPYFFPNTCIAWRGAVAVLVSFCQTWLFFFPQPNTCAKSLPNTTAHSRGNTYILYIRMPRMHVLLEKNVQNICLDTSFICLHLQLDPRLNRLLAFCLGCSCGSLSCKHWILPSTQMGAFCFLDG